MPRPYRLLLTVFSLLLIVSGTILVTRLISYRAAQREYEAYQQEIPSEPVLPAAEPVDLRTPEPEAPRIAASAPPAFYSGKVAVLMQDNRDTVGWIDVPGTKIQYPIVQGSDNEYYMHHTFAKKRNESGAIFMDSACAPSFASFNTVIYGHNMNDGTMFHLLHSYRDQSFANEHNFVEITQLHSKKRYRIFAAYISEGEEDFDFRSFSSTSEEKRRTFIRALRKRSEIDIPATVSVDDQLLTLVTCTSGSHPWYWVVHAVLVSEQVTAAI